MRTLPLFYYSGTWLAVDDDRTLLSCMNLALEEHSSVKTYPSGKSCLSFLNKYQSVSSQKNLLHSNKNAEDYGVLRHTPIDFDITRVVQLADDITRHEEITAMVIDYHMPEMNGFSLAKACEHLPIYKILLTGDAKDEVIISGFNHNYIQRFMRKGSEDMEDKLVMHLKDLSFQYFQKITAPLLAHLEAENLISLSDPIFVDFFLEYCAKNNICEYYLIDKQGSFLCIDKNGKRFYLVVQTDRSMDTWLETYFTGVEFDANFGQLIKDRKLIPFFGQGKEAWHLETVDWQSYFYKIDGILEGREKYYWFEISKDEFEKKHWK